MSQKEQATFVFTMTLTTEIQLFGYKFCTVILNNELRRKQKLTQQLPFRPVVILPHKKWICGYSTL